MSSSAQTITTRILDSGLESLSLAANALRASELVALPTETVYGLAANALQSDAVLKIFSAKERPHFDPLIVHVLDTHLEALEASGLLDSSQLTLPLRQVAQTLIDRFWPGPMTLVLPRNAKRVPDLVTSGLETVAIRCPAHPVMRKVLELTEFPLAAPSANRFGRISPTTAQHVRNELDGRIRWIVDGGRCQVGIESTILHLSPQNPQKVTCLRPGGLGLNLVQEALHQLGAELVFPSTSQVRSSTHFQAPGMLPSHYAPSKPLRLLSDWNDLEKENLNGKKLGLLAWSGNEDTLRADLANRGIQAAEIHVRILSRKGKSEEAARHLFHFLRELDDSSSELLFAQIPPVLDLTAATDGLAYAIRDRLTRAAATRGSENTVGAS